MSASRADVLRRLQLIFNDTFMDEVVVTPGLKAGDVEEWDSLLHTALVMAVEKSFKIRFKAGEAESTQNIGEFADLILARTQSA